MCAQVTPANICNYITSPLLAGPSARLKLTRSDQIISDHNRSHQISRSRPFQQSDQQCSPFRSIRSAVLSLSSYQISTAHHFQLSDQHCSPFPAIRSAVLTLSSYQISSAHHFQLGAHGTCGLAKSNHVERAAPHVGQQAGERRVGREEGKELGGLPVHDACATSYMGGGNGQ